MRHLLLSLLLACGPLSDSTTDSVLSTGPGLIDVDLLPMHDFPSFMGPVPKNLLVISMDTFRRDSLSRYGGDPEWTPFLNEIAATGVSLDQHTSCSNWTFASVVCTMNGRTNLDNQFMPKLSHEHRGPIPPGPTMASWLADAGFYTMLVSSNSWFSDQYDSDQGFAFSRKPDSVGTKNLYDLGMRELDDALDAGIDRWYLHLHVKEPHVPYKPPESYLTGLDSLEPIDYDLTVSDAHYDLTGAWDDVPEEDRDLVTDHMLVRYRGELNYLDDLISDIFDDLTDRDLLDDTLVVFWTDHGEQFWEHGNQTHAYHMHREENDAIALLWAANIVPFAWDEPTNHIDITPTVLKVFGLDIPPEVTGKAVGDADPERPIFASSVARLGTVQSVTQGGWKLIYRWKTGEKLAYDLVADPMETVNRFDPEDPKVQQLWELLSPRIDGFIPLVPEASPLNPEL